MTLDLNETIQPYRAFPEEGTAPNTEQMPLLISGKDSDGNVVDIPRVPFTVADVMERRLNSSKPDWKANHFDTGDGIAYHPDGKFKIVLDAAPLRTLTPKSKLNNGALVLGDGVYETLEGPEFKFADVEGFTGRGLSSDEAKANPIWKVAARDSGLLVAYVDNVFPEMKEKFEYNDGMGVYLGSSGKMPTLRALCVGGLSFRSWLFGYNFLRSGGVGRLVGKAPEAQGAPGKAIVRPSLETCFKHCE